MYQVTLRRNFQGRRRHKDQKGGLGHIVGKALRSPFHGTWSGHINQVEPVFTRNGAIYGATITFSKNNGRMGPEQVQREWVRILTRVVDSCHDSRFGEYPWEILDATDRELVNLPQDDNVIVANGEVVVVDARGDEFNNPLPPNRQPEAVTPLYTRHVVDESGGISFEEFKDRANGLIDRLLHDDGALSENEHFKDIFGRNAQIRTILSSVKSFLDSNGQRRNHSLLFGLPACAKTQILRAVASFLGSDAVLKMDASATSPAGIYRLFFDELEVVPPIVILEEVEKANEEGLKVWLGALDDRGELRKINYREMKVREVRVLCLATVNDKDKFDGFMGGSSAKPGPLSSRFVHQLQCPRPDREIMRRILYRDINKKGGHTSWIEPALRLADAIGTNDPRRVLGLLDGGNRLLTGEYQEDVLTIEDKLNLLDGLSKSEVEAA